MVRRRPYTPYLAALASGVGMAYRNRKAATELGSALRNITISTKKVFPKKRKGTKMTKSNVTRANGRSYAGGNDLTTTKRKIYSRRPRTYRSKINRNSMLIKGLMTNEVYRFQNLTRYDTDVGAIALRQGYNSSLNAVYSPVHVYDITSFNNETSVVAGYQLGWNDVASTADMIKIPIPCQTTAGTGTSSFWQQENNAAATPYPAAMKALHNWTSIGFNFYGPRKRTTWFEVMFITMKDEFADLMYASGSNPSVKLLLQYLERPLIYSNLQTDVGGKAHNMFKVVKRFRYYVSASQTTDVDTSVGKIKEAKIFMRHDRMRDYHWQHNDFDTSSVIPHGENDGIDFTRDDDVHNYPAYGKRMYMVVRAFSPERVTFTNDALAVDANRDPTYDIIMRNSFSFVRSLNS